MITARGILLLYQTDKDDMVAPVGEEQDLQVDPARFADGLSAQNTARSRG